MLRATLMTDKGPLGLVGISDENLRRMRAGMPLDINLKDITPQGHRMNRVVVHLGHTYEDVVRDWMEGGIPDTEKMLDIAQKLDVRLAAERVESAEG